MGIIKIYSKSKPKKKPGAAKEKAEYDAWLAKINAMTLFNPAAKPKMQGTTKSISPIAKTRTDIRGVRASGPSRVTPGGSTGEHYTSMEVFYKENPEMLAREMEARERRFNSAPLYNKAGPQLVTDEMMKDVKMGLTRRR